MLFYVSLSSYNRSVFLILSNNFPFEFFLFIHLLIQTTLKNIIIIPSNTNNIIKTIFIVELSSSFKIHFSPDLSNLVFSGHFDTQLLPNPSASIK